MNQKNNKIKSFKRAALLSTIGINLVVTSILGFLIGLWLDERFGTTPWLTIIFFIIGVIAGFLYIVRLCFKNNDNFPG